MSAADEAYKAAVKEIERVRAQGGTSLDLSETRLPALTKIPREIEGWRELEILNLGHAQIKDITPLAGLTGLQRLLLWGTNITEIKALSGLTTLIHLDLTGTRISDLAPIAGLKLLKSLNLLDTSVYDVSAIANLITLESLDLRETKVRDLRPILNLPLNHRKPNWGLSFSGTPAAALDPNLAELAGITDGNERTEKTLGSGPVNLLAFPRAA